MIEFSTDPTIGEMVLALMFTAGIMIGITN